MFDDERAAIKLRSLFPGRGGAIRTRVLAALLLVGMLSVVAGGQNSFVAIPPQLEPRYHINFARTFFAGPEAEKADRENLSATLKALEALKGRIAGSADNLERALQLSDRVKMQASKHSSYLYLRNAVDTNDEASLADGSALDAEVTRRAAFVRQELIGMDDRALASLVVRKPQLKAYLPAIEAIRRYRSHTLSLKEEELLSALAPDNDWQFELYDKLRALTPVSPLQRDLYAFSLLRLARARTRFAEVHHFADAASEVYFNSYWTRAEVDALVEQIDGKIDLYKRYQGIRATFAKKKGSTEKLLGESLPRFAIDQASEIIRNALAPLGANYARELAALLDPANGRMDIVPGEHRKRGGFSKGFIGTDSVFYSGGFRGYYNDVRVLTHESTHAIHRQLMNRGQVLPAYAEGPHYLFESFAIFSEFLLPDYLYNNETDPLRKQYYLEQFLDGKGMIMFVVAPEVALEHSVYDGLKHGSIKGADDLDALTRRIYSRYSNSPQKQDELKSQWMNIGLMYEDPFYDANYIYGAVLALKFYEMYTRDRERFIPRYIALMRNGFDAPPPVLLKRFLEIDLNDPRLVSTALSILEDKVSLLEESYQH